MATDIDLSRVPDGVRIVITGSQGVRLQLTLSPADADRIGQQLRQLASRIGVIR